MKRLVGLIAALAALAIPSTASADVFNGNEIASGQNFCAFNVTIVQAGAFSSAIDTSQGQGTCSVPGNPPGFTTPTCSAGVHRHAGSLPADSNTSGGLTNCPLWEVIGQSFAQWGGFVRFRLDLTGLPQTFYACGQPLGTGCLTAGYLNGPDPGQYTWACNEGEAHKVKDCTFRIEHGGAIH